MTAIVTFLAATLLQPTTAGLKARATPVVVQTFRSAVSPVVVQTFRSAVSPVVVQTLRSAVSGEQTAAMKTVEKGLYSAVDDARQVVVRTPAEWAKVWQTHSFERARPAVDFTKEMVVGVFMGSRPSAGFNVEIVGTRLEGGTLFVQYRETKPAAGMMTAQILTSPYHLVSVPRVDGDVKFEPVP